MRAFLVTFPLLLSACAAATPAPEETCAAPAQPFASPRALDAARAENSLAAATFATGEAIRFRLHPDGEVGYLTLPRGGGEEASFGGIAAVRIERAGLYRVGVDKPAWVDVVQDGKAAESLAHGHGGPCTGLRKRVEFRLQQGPAVLEMSGGEDAELSAIVERIGD